ncbi:uncharacterized protein LOC112506274 [Cynara cardunculus var. scolymus]|uniref:uncharacterized protein LOC112506274 n=1 Tax=Cynara cardunculus var. scolymus TaxID=59895 RepID=UPI000D627C3B|nr:uncharacterized protein LOC112506274 [Cynara cardunculus var. scolymus]
MLFQNEADIIFHLKDVGIIKNYTVWDQHGEVTNIPTASQRWLNIIRDRASLSHNVNPIVNFVEDAFPFRERYNDGESIAHESTPVCDVDIVTSKVIDAYARLLAETNTPLYDGCTETSLGALLRAISLKEETGISIKAFDKHLGFQKSLLPTPNKLPKSYAEAKKILKGVGMGYELIHACLNGCFLYYKEGDIHDQCPVCGLPRYDDVGNKVPMKIVRYFPLTLRLQRLYMSKYTADHMRWHGQRETSPYDDVLRHPADGEAWKDFDRSYPQFASDLRNVRLALSTDGFSFFGASATPYSIWPIVVIPYNLPPSICMQKEFNILTMTWDRYGEEYFTMKAVVMWTISDFPGLGMLGGIQTKGYKACPICLDDTDAKFSHGRMSYMGARRWLDMNHEFRIQGRNFNGKDELRLAPQTRTAIQIHMSSKRTQAFNLAKASVLGRTTARLEGDSVEISSEATPSVQRQLYLPSLDSPTTPASSETSTPGQLALDIRINCRRIQVEPTE